jgi:ABC-2 type transport system ATP-binding protein
MQNNISIAGISKTFGTTEALQGIDLKIRSGELFGLIGPDGAGKTTLFRILTSLLRPDTGQATVAGLDTVQDYRQLRRILGYMPGDFSLYQDLSVEENLHFFATIFGTTIAENYHLIEDIYVQLEPFRRRRAGKLSGGMKQKLALCCALIHEPQVLFLDEPTTGVDAVSRAEFWDMLDRLKTHGITIVVSTPYMDEAARCERVALMQEGQILQVDTPAAIVASYDAPLYAVRAREFYRLLQDLRTADFTVRVEPFGEFLHLTTTEPPAGRDIEAFLRARDHAEIVVKPTAATIEDVFLSLLTAEGQA